KAVRIKMGDLDTWSDERGTETLARPYRKQQCAFYFWMRPNVTWHDGKPFTAEDVKFTMDCLLNVNILAQSLRSYFKDIESYSLIDNGGIRFQARKPYFQQMLFLCQVYPIPKHVFNPEQFGGDEKAFADAFNKHPFRASPVGCGPYKMKEWKKGDRLTVVRFDDYWASKLPAGAIHNWLPGQPYMDEITQVVIAETAASLKELEKGTIDADMDVEPETWDQARTNAKEFTDRITRAKRYGFLYTYIALNNLSPIFRDPATRRAFAMLIPRERVGKDVYKGLSDLVTGPNYSRGPGYEPSVPQVPYDPETAKRILRKAGWLDRDGDHIIEKEVDGKTVPFEFEYLIHGAREYHQKVADIYKESIEQAGIKMTVRKLDFNVLMDKTRDKDFTVSRQAWGTELDPDPFQIWHSSQSENKGSNIISYKNEKADRLMERLREEFDPVKRWEMAREVHRIIAEDQPVVFLEGFWETYFISRGVRGVKLYPSPYPYRLREWWWSDPKRREAAG
ncbi:hypothetical protein HZA57_02170, partial [Candidatus Poribacteria bacterium]|nr:hypothetical protein [Candidatus Poribacteria bacterium]